jgi:hypothetical protein
MARYRQKPTQRAVNKRRKNSRASKNELVPPRTLEEFFAMPELDQEFWSNVGQVVTEMRAGASRSKASRKFGLDPRKVSQVARPALRKLRNGRWAAKTHDHLLRVLVIPTREGLREIGINDSRQATFLGEYWNAVERYLSTGDASALWEFRGKYIIDANPKRIPLLTDLRELNRLGSAGVLSFESIYARAA